MSVVGADVAQLRATANQFTQAADLLQGTLKGLANSVGNASFWRGPDSERFRSEWHGHSVSSLDAAIRALQSAAEVLRRNADEQDEASRENGGSGRGSAVSASRVGHHEPAAVGLNDMWREIISIPNTADSSGYRVQRVLGEDGVERYVVYIVGTGMSSTQTRLEYFDAAWFGNLDEEQVLALEALIPEDAEVMLVGYSQGGVDAQNIAASGRLNVTQVVSFGSPVRTDINVPAIHLQAVGDGVPGSAAGFPGPYFASAIAADNDPSVFRGESSISRTGVNGVDIHSNAYADLSRKFDGEAATGSGRATDAAESLRKFQGGVIDQVDINAKGTNKSWK